MVAVSQCTLMYRLSEIVARDFIYLFILSQRRHLELGLRCFTPPPSISRTSRFLRSDRTLLAEWPTILVRVNDIMVLV